MAGHNNTHNSPRQQGIQALVEILVRENKREKREKVLPLNPIPNQRRCAHVLRIAAVLNQPLTRAPTRTPCGEAGSEDSWLRLLSGSNQSCSEDRPNRTTT